MLEIRALIDDWRDSARTRLLMDADQVARDPRLALVGSAAAARSGIRLFPRGSSVPSTAEGRYAEACRRMGRPVEVAPARMEEAAFARVHLVDLFLLGQALEHASRQRERLRVITPSTRAQLMGEVLRGLEARSDELLRRGASEGRTRKGMTWELDRIRSYLSPEALERMTEPLRDRELPDRTRLTIEGLGTVGAIVPSSGAPSLSVLSLASSFMTGNYTLLALPIRAAATTMLVAEVADSVLRERRVHALSAVVPDGPRELLGILSESPRVNALLTFYQSEAELEAQTQAASLGKAVVGAWDTGDVAVVWDSADIASAARTIVEGRFTDTGLLPSSIHRVLVQSDSADALASALEGEIHSLQVGLPSDPTTDVGPVGELVVLEHLQEVVAEARELGASVVHGGERIDWRGDADPLGVYFQPTLVTGCDAGMRIVNERVAGPVLPVVPVREAGDIETMACRPTKPCRVWLWATSRADRDRLVETLKAPVIVFSGLTSQGLGGGLDLSDAWGALELSERLSYRSWHGPEGQ